MNQLTNVVQYILGFGPTVLLPIVLFILGLVFRLKIGRALRSALTVGIGFVGIYAIFDVFTGSVGPAAQAMVDNAGVDLQIVDLGWPPLSAITWGGPIAPVVIFTTIVINIVMIAMKWTKTVDVDLWNYWHFALVGTLVYYTTGSFWLGILASAILTVVTLKIADWAAPMGEKYFGLEGISLPTVSSATFFPIGLLGNRIIDAIPGIRNIEINPQTVQKRFGIFGEPMMIGTILGLLLGFLAGYDIQGVLTLGISVGAVMFILPRMVAILMEGLIPISDAVKKYLSNRYPDRDDLYIGLDIAVAVGNPAVISTALLLTPIAVVLAVVLPGVNILPLGDLSNLAVFISMVVLATKGNVFRSVVIAIPMIIGDLYISTNIAPLVTEMAEGVNFQFPEGSSGLVSSFLDGGNPLRYWILQIFELNWIALTLIPVIGIIVFWLYKTTRTQILLSDSKGE